MKDMIGYCGLDCEKCDAYLATINNDQALREKTAKLWAESVSYTHLVYSRELGISGECDVVEFHRSQDGITLFGRDGLYEVCLLYTSRCV